MHILRKRSHPWALRDNAANAHACFMIATYLVHDGPRRARFAKSCECALHRFGAYPSRRLHERSLGLVTKDIRKGARRGYDFVEGDMNTCVPPASLKRLEDCD